MKCVLICSTALFEAFLIRRKIQRDITIRAKVVFRSVRYFCQILMGTSIFLMYFKITSIYQHFITIIPVEGDWFHADGRKDMLT